ncbi:MAG: GMC family oxidoreductase [Actinomycetota bacterium]|nr:GMC family oxidoreductase [Actinomycetota bacterium]
MRWVVVGAGTAGCVVATRLCERQHEVTVVEQGPDLTERTTPDAIASIDYVDALANGARIGSVRARRTAGAGLIAYPVGCGIGGSDAVNGLVLDRGRKEDYRAWGWIDADEAIERVRIRGEEVNDQLLGVVDRALLAAAPAARRARLSIVAGRRATTAGAYLGPLRDRGLLEVVTGRRVDRVRLSNRTAVGVALDDGDVIAADAVALCAGALSTPALLLRSGIEDLPVGVGLQDHPSVSIALRLRDPAARAPVATGVVLTLGDVQVTTMNHTAPDATYGAVSVALLTPHSRGRVELDGDGAPVADFGQFGDGDDLHRLVAGVRAVEELLHHDAFTAIAEACYTDDTGTPVALSEGDDVEAWVSRGGGPWVHPSSSCPIGSVLDGDGRVLGYDALFVIDASAFPQIPAAPTALPTMILAERLASRLAVL